MALRTCQLSFQLVVLCPLTQPRSQKENLSEWPLVGCCHPQRELCFSLSHCPHVTPYNSSPVLPAVLNASCMHAQSCLTLCNPMDYSPPDASIHGVFQARILEWVVIPFSRGSSQSRDRTDVTSIFCIGKRIIYHWAIQEVPNTSLSFPIQPWSLLHSWAEISLLKKQRSWLQTAWCIWTDHLSLTWFSLRVKSMWRLDWGGMLVHEGQTQSFTD